MLFDYLHELEFRCLYSVLKNSLETVDLEQTQWKKLSVSWVWWESPRLTLRSESHSITNTRLSQVRSRPACAAWGNLDSQRKENSVQFYTNVNCREERTKGRKVKEDRQDLSQHFITFEYTFKCKQVWTILLNKLN